MISISDESANSLNIETLLTSILILLHRCSHTQCEHYSLSHALHSSLMDLLLLLCAIGSENPRDLVRFSVTYTRNVGNPWVSQIKRMTWRVWFLNVSFLSFFPLTAQIAFLQDVGHLPLRKFPGRYGLTLFPITGLRPPFTKCTHLRVVLLTGVVWVLMLV